MDVCACISESPASGGGVLVQKPCVKDACSKALPAGNPNETTRSLVVPAERDVDGHLVDISFAYATQPSLV